MDKVEGGNDPTCRAELGIDTNKMYTMPNLKFLTGFGGTAFKAMRDKGLIVRYIGRAAFIDGRDFVDHIREHGTEERKSGLARNQPRGFTPQKNKVAK